MNLVYRRINEKDFLKIKILFYKVFKRKISKKFYNWRYLDNLKYNSFAVFDNKKLIAHVGFVKYELNKSLNNSKKYIYSRHSSMVDIRYRNKNIYSKLLNFSFLKLKINNLGFIVWPNQINFLILKKKNDYYKFSTHSIYSIDIINNKKNIYSSLYNFFDSKDVASMDNFFDSFKQNSILNKDFDYFSNRYLKYDKKNYKFAVKKVNEEYLSMFVLSFEYKKDTVIVKVFDFYSIKNNFLYELNNLIQFLSMYFQNKYKINLLFWSANQIKTSIFSHKINRIDKNFNICFIPNNISDSKFNHSIGKFKFFMGDTDVFCNIDKTN